MKKILEKTIRTARFYGFKMMIKKNLENRIFLLVEKIMLVDGVLSDEEISLPLFDNEDMKVMINSSDNKYHIELKINRGVFRSNQYNTIDIPNNYDELKELSLLISEEILEDYSKLI